MDRDDALRACQNLCNLKYEMLTGEMREIKELLDRLNLKVDTGFKSYDNKFWGLAVMTISILITAVGVLVFYMLTKP